MQKDSFPFSEFIQSEGIGKGLGFRESLRGFLSCFRPRFKVLAYHSISEVSRNPFEVKAEEFDKQMGFLAKEGYNVISLEEGIHTMAEGMIRSKTVVITFDDGFTNLSVFAFPLLRRFDFPAKIFLPFDYLGGFDVFSYKEPRPDMAILDWPDIEDSMKYGISYGSHTMSHRNLVDMDDSTLCFELRESKRILKRRLGLEFYALAYPFGIFDERVKKAVQDTGYDCALCFGNIISNTSATDRFEIKREKILNSTSLKDFARLVDVGNDFRRKVIDLTARSLVTKHSRANIYL